jgi:hypothetical protein
MFRESLENLCPESGLSVQTEEKKNPEKGAVEPF